MGIKEKESKKKEKRTRKKLVETQNASIWTKNIIYLLINIYLYASISILKKNFHQYTIVVVVIY